MMMMIIMMMMMMMIMMMMMMMNQKEGLLFLFSKMQGKASNCLLYSYTFHEGSNYNLPRCDWYLNHIIPREKQPANFFFSLTYISVFGKNVFEGTRLLHIGVFIRHSANFRIFALDEFELFRVKGDIVYHNQSLAIVPIAE